MFIVLLLTVWLVSSDVERLYFVQKQQFDAVTSEPMGKADRISDARLTALECNRILWDAGPLPVEYNFDTDEASGWYANGWYTLYRCVATDSLGEAST